MKNFHSGAGTMTSAFGNAGLLSAVEQAVDVVAVEVRDDHDVDRVAVDAGGGQVGVELASGAFAALELAGPLPVSITTSLEPVFTTIGVIRDRHLSFSP